MSANCRKRHARLLIKGTNVRLSLIYAERKQNYIKQIQYFIFTAYMLLIFILEKMRRGRIALYNYEYLTLSLF